MKKIMAATALAFAFAAVAGSATTRLDVPIPNCLPCTPGSPRSVAAVQMDVPIPNCLPCAPGSSRV